MLNTIEIIELIKARNKALKELNDAKIAFVENKTKETHINLDQKRSAYHYYTDKIYTFEVCIELFNILEGKDKVIIDVNDEGIKLIGYITRNNLPILKLEYFDESHSE